MLHKQATPGMNSDFQFMFVFVILPLFTFKKDEVSNKQWFLPYYKTRFGGRDHKIMSAFE